MKSKPIVIYVVMVAALSFMLVALFTPSAHAQQVTVEVNPGEPGNPAIDFNFETEEDAYVIDVLFKDNKTLEYGKGTHIIFFSPGDFSGGEYIGALLDAARGVIPDTTFFGKFPKDGDPGGLPAILNLSQPTVFGGIRYIAVEGIGPGLPQSPFYSLKWVGTPPTVLLEGDPVTIGGSVTGLEGSGLVLQNNGADDLPLDTDGAFAFDTPLEPFRTYNVTVLKNPEDPTQICNVENGSGTVPTENVTDVSVTCVEAELSDIKKVAAEGDTLADNTVLKDILLDGGVGINLNGQVAFGGRDGDGYDAVFTQGGRVVKEGDTLDDGTIFRAFRGQGEVAINAGQGQSGDKVAFHGQAETGMNDTAAVFIQTGKVAAEGDPLSEGIVINDIAPEGKVAINNAEQVAFHGSIEVEGGFFDKFFRVIFIADEVEIWAAVREGSKLPDDTLLDDITESGGVAISDLDEVAFHGYTVNPERGGDSLKAVFTSWGLVAREGADLADGTILDDINENGGVAINLIGQVAFHGQTVIPDRGGDSAKAVFIADGNDIQVVAKVGDKLGDGSTLDDIDVSGGVAINLFGDVVFHGQTGGVKAVFNQGGVVAKVGDIVNNGSTLEGINSSAGVAMNPYDRQVAFHGRVDSVDAVFVSLTPTPNAKPEADFIYTTDNLTVNFKDLSRDSDGDVVAWSWNFGDGSTSAEQNPSHTYTAAGTYTVTLTVTDDQDTASEEAAELVEVSAPPSGEVVQVFVTQTAYQGDLGEFDPSGIGDGLAGADAICQERAEAANLSGTWRAWLSDSENDAIDRIPDGQYRLVNGTQVADDKVDLTDGLLNAAINLNEYGQVQSGIAWTATNPDGTGTGNNCKDWTDSSSEQGGCAEGDPNCGSVGSTVSANTEWTKLNAAPFQCSAQYNLYCFGGVE